MTIQGFPLVFLRPMPSNVSSTAHKTGFLHMFFNRSMRPRSSMRRLALKFQSRVKIGPVLRHKTSLTGFFGAGAHRIGFVLLLCVMVFNPRSSSASDCEVALVLALDASSSVDSAEFHLQSRGMAAALLDREVRAAIIGVGGVLMTAYEWSGRRQHAIIADWAMLESDEEIARFAGRLADHNRAYVEFPTAVGYALGFGAVRLARAPISCNRRVIDVSGDGVHNEGFPPASAYRAFDFGGVTVNGLVIKGEKPDPEPYYRKNVLFGTGAFLEIATSYEDYANAMKRKLLREIGGAMVSSTAH